MKILFIGKPGAGKGTITQNLMKEDSNFLQLSTGDLLREEVKRGTPLGKEIDELLKQGNLLLMTLYSLWLVTFLKIINLKILFLMATLEI